MNLDYSNYQDDMIRTINTDILIIGTGGAGLRAAIQSHSTNLSVVLLGKRHREDSHTVLAAGGINASFGNLDQADNWEQHFVDTYNEGYRLGSPQSIENLCKDSPEAVKEIDIWGANFQKLENGLLDQRFFGAHTYRRTCYSGDYTGKSILFTLLAKVNKLNIPILDNEYVVDLLIENNICIGALSFNIDKGNITIYNCKSLILATGGHTGNWKRSTSRRAENNGDGMHLGLKSGCELIDMEMVQFHPTGMIGSEGIDGKLVTEAVRGEGGRLLNILGERFMSKYDPNRLELSTRDKVCIANYQEIKESRSSPNGGVYLDISHLPKDIIISKLPTIYNQYLDLLDLDISKYPMEVAPTAHYSMGGILVSSDEHCTNIKGLYAVGEVAGGLHGANRLGGNSLSEIIVYGKRVGIAASDHALSIVKAMPITTSKISALKDFKDKINKMSNDLHLSRDKLGVIMWSKCGVVRNHSELVQALKQINKLTDHLQKRKNTAPTITPKLLTEYFNLESALVTSKATVLSAIARAETRGAHNRSDFPDTISQGIYNTRVHYTADKRWNTYTKLIPNLNINLKKLIDKSVEIDLDGKLIE